MSPTPEKRACQDIDAALEAAGWIIQDRAAMNLSAGAGVAVREFKMASGHGFADYALEAARACLDHGFQHTSSESICSIVRPSNDASCATAARLHSNRREFIKNGRPAIVFFTRRAGWSGGPAGG